MGQTIDDTQVINLLSRLAILVGGPESAIIRVEDQIFPLIQNLIRHFSGRLFERNRSLPFQSQPQLTGFARILELGRCPHQQIGVRILVAIATGLEDLQRLVTKLLFVPSTQIVNSHQQRIIHDVEFLQELDVSPELRHEHLLFHRALLEMSFSSQPVEILHRRSRIPLQIFFTQIATDGRPLEVERLVDVSVRWEKIVHHDEMDLATIGHLHAVKAVELRDQRVRVVLDMSIVFRKDLAEQLVLGVVDRLDDVLVVAREVEEAATLPGRPQFRQDVFARQRHQVVRRIQLEFGPQTPKDPGRVIFELEIVFGGGR